MNPQKTLKISDSHVPNNHDQKDGQQLANNLSRSPKLNHIVSEAYEKHYGYTSQQIPDVRNWKLPSPDRKCHKRRNDKSNTSH
ncbi:hypothetical protein [Algoriphagus terrigena]|uniref:hypothetical protein n=1 Tax=Algoriphagus terrigena TaxID=344884 RepID=UPI001FE14003|nr:hypothetical protein [Algoriphagus terrigena]